MRPIRTLRAAGLIAAGALLIAACGSNGATTAPTTGAASTAPTTAPVSVAPVPTEVAAASDALPSFDLSSFHGDQDLESMIPTTVGGQTLTTLSMTGDQFLGDGSSSPQLAGALTALGKTPADLSVAFAGSTKITIVAFRVQGVPASTLFDAFKSAASGNYTATSVSYGGKNVTKVEPGDDTISFIYLKDDTMFLVGSPGSGATAPSDDLLNEAFQKLP
jgi:hypothetical protein